MNLSECATSRNFCGATLASGGLLGMRKSYQSVNMQAKTDETTPTFKSYLTFGMCSSALATTAGIATLAGKFPGFSK